MGRGSSNRSVTKASELLFGPRRSGSGPQDSQLFAPPDSFDGLDWRQYIEGLTNLTYQLGLSAKPASGLDKKDYQGTRALIIDIKQNDRKRLCLIPNVSAEGNNVGIYYLEKESDGAIVLEGGQEKVDSRNQGEMLLREQLKQRGVKRLGLILSGSEVLSRLDSGAPIRLTGGTYPLGNQDDHSWPAQTGRARFIVSQSSRHGNISDEAEDKLHQLLNGLDEGADILTAFVNDPAGRRVIALESHLYVEEILNN